MQIVLQTKYDKTQVVVYQLLRIWTKCSMFYDHVLVYF
jgi:hypothetical protein